MQSASPARSRPSAAAASRGSTGDACSRPQRRVRPDHVTPIGNTMNIDYAEKIPNNVDLAGDKTLQRALEHWQPEFLRWWGDMGPEGTSETQIYLRTAVSVDPKGWRISTTSECPSIAGGSFSRQPRPAAMSTSARTRARLRGRKFPASIARTCGGSS